MKLEEKSFFQKQKKNTELIWKKTKKKTKKPTHKKTQQKPKPTNLNPTLRIYKEHNAWYFQDQFEKILLSAPYRVPAS